MDHPDIEARVRRFCGLLKVISDERRLMILHHLAEKEHSVSQLVELTRLSPSGVSQHLARLRRADLVTSRRHAQAVHYSLNRDRMAALVGAMGAVCRAEPKGMLGSDCGDAKAG